MNNNHNNDDNSKYLRLLNAAYDPETEFVRLEKIREGGSSAYAVYTAKGKFFMKLVGNAFADTIAESTAVSRYLFCGGFPVPEIITARDGRAFVRSEDGCVILYAFLEAEEIDVEADAGEIGALIGSLHERMSGYGGALAVHGKPFYIDRYTDILKKKRYPRADEFISYGEALWTRVKTLPTGYSHGDMYSGNIGRVGKRLYLFDLDTSCIGFPTYDLALICNQTHYFNYDPEGLRKTKAVYSCLLPEYRKRRGLTEAEIGSLCDMIALYHFALQATIIEIYGPDCVDGTFFDKQLDWLIKWKKQCETEPGI